MKTKKASKTNISRLIFFTIALTYNLILGFYLRDFLVLSPTLQVFYLLSALPALFLAVEIKTKAMRAVVYILLILIACMNIAYAIYCRRVFPFLAIVSLAIVLMYYTSFSNNTSKDNLLTKIYVLIVSTLIIALLFTVYIFVYKQENVSLANGQATLWDTANVKLADEICSDCDTDEERVKAIYEWMIHNFEYDYDYHAVIQYFDVRQTLRTHKGVCYDFSNLFAALCRSQGIPCYVIDGIPYDSSLADHTWNRVYYNNSWWDLDVTNDMSASKDNKNIYGFHKLESSHSADTEYRITKIY